MKLVSTSIWCVGVLSVRTHLVGRKEPDLGDASFPASLGRCCSIRLSSQTSANTCLVIATEMKIFLRQFRLPCLLYRVN